MTKDELVLHLEAMREKSFQAGVRWSRKRERAIENREIVINTNTSQYQMPSPFNPKELKTWLKSFYKQKKKPINANTGWTISVPGTGIEETLNHLYRNRKNYRSDLHYLSLPYIDKMLENAEFEKFDEVEQGKNADAISIFNVIVDFGGQGKYNARMVIKHFGEVKNFHDHKLTKFEELSDLELLPEGSGSLNNSSTSTNIPQTGEKSNNNFRLSRKNIYTGSAADVDEHIRYSLKKRHQQNPVVRDSIVRDEWEDILERNKYTPQKLEELRNKAFEWIERAGGIVPAAEAFLNDKAPAVAAVAEVARRYIINSDVFVNDVDYEDRVKLYEQDQDVGTSLGRALRARRADVTKIRCFFDI